MWSSTKWFFEDGAPNGINDSGVSSFKKSRYKGLVREIIQNSLDAGLSDKLVKVVFKRTKFTMDKFPNYKDFLENVEKCIDFVKSEPQNKAHKVYDNLKRELNSCISTDSFEVLEISDYNTIGLSCVDDPVHGDFANLVRISGNNNKGYDAGGSFGIGKYAPFGFSSTRTIIYSTKNLDGQIGVQGKTILSGHYSSNKTKSPLGYFGSVKKYERPNENGEIINSQENCLPFTNPNDFPSEYLRDEFGTSLFVLNANFNDNWYKEVIVSVLSYFLKTIIDNNLIVEVIDTINDLDFEISSNTLQDKINLSILNDYEEMDSIKYLYNLLISDNTREFEDNINLNKVGIDGDGEVKLSVLIDDNLKFSSIHYTRKNGMVITNKPKPNSLVTYTALFTTVNENMNRFLRDCEGPEHDEWSYNNFGEEENDHINAKSILRQMSEWIRDCIRESCGKNQSEKIDVLGMQEFLPLDYDGENSSNSSELLINKTVNTVLQKTNDKIKQKTTSSKNNYIEVFNSDEFFEGSNGEHNNIDSNSVKLNNGSVENIINLIECEKGDFSQKRKLSISNVRTPYMEHSNIYRVTFMSNETIENCSLVIRRGGTDLFEELKIEKMFQIINEQKIECNTFNLINGEKIFLEVILSKKIRGALEVSCYVTK